MPAVVAPRRLSDGADGMLCTPVKRSVSPTTGSPVPRMSRIGSIETPVRVDTSSDDAGSSDSETSNKRKRTSIGSSTATALSNDRSSTTKKRRARLSLTGPGTPGKANPMDSVRERDVAKRFLELEVSEVYKAIRKQTGALGGNAAGGAIYGEITQNSFQRVVDYMKEHCDLSASSRFLDVGSGLGKPNFHVAIDPGVEVSYGIELEELRWHLSLHNLKSVLRLDSSKHRSNRTVFTAGDITDAQSLNPFSHVYSFDVGFPPDVMDHMARIFNKSDARYFVSFHAPRKIIDTYEFDVENIGRVATSMAGSSEGHTCYFYRREESSLAKRTSEKEKEALKRRRTAPTRTTTLTTTVDSKDDLLHIDPLFRPGFDVLRREKEGVLAWVVDFFGEQHGNGRTRHQKRTLQARKPVERPLESYYRIVGKARVADRHSKK